MVPFESSVRTLLPSKRNRNTANASVEFDIHGLIGIRLIDASSDDVEAVLKQVGDFRRALRRRPDITIRFARKLATASLQPSGQDEELFQDQFFNRSVADKATKFRIPFGQLGGPCEVIYASEQKSLPFLMPILSLAGLTKRCVAVHGSAFVQNGTGIILAGAAGSGKTSTLLKFMSMGAEFIADDWVLLQSGADNMYGLSGQIELSLPAFEVLGRGEFSIRGARRLLVRALCPLVIRFRKRETNEPSFPRRVVGKALAVAGERLIPKRDPRALFPGQVGSLTAKPAKLFLLCRDDQTRVVVERITASEMAPKIARLIEREQGMLMDCYAAFRLAFPHRANPLLDRIAELQERALTKALAKLECYVVRHPRYSVFAELHKKISPFCAPTEHTATGLSAHA